MLGICLDCNTHKILSSSTHFAWAPASSLKYLGIQLVVPSSNLLSLNYETLLKKLQVLSNDLCSICASWLSKIVCTKMFLLPHVLYLFHSLLIADLLSQLTTRPGRMVRPEHEFGSIIGCSPHLWNTRICRVFALPNTLQCTMQCIVHPTP